MIGQISIAADEVARGSAQIADGTTELAQGTAEQSTSIEELYSSIGVLNGRIKQITNAEKEELPDTEDMDDQQTDAYIDAAQTLTGKLLFAMECTRERLENISRISSAIQQVSSETGMLALNASVEAAHAGEYGKGFAVIAAEIRALSEKSREEARDTEKQLRSIRRAVEHGGAAVAEVISAIQEMSVSMTDFENALSMISDVIENTASTVEESAAGSEELSAQAEALKELVSGFKYNEKRG